MGLGRLNNPNTSVLSAHPHTDTWKQIPGLVHDGVHYSRERLANAGVEFLRPRAKDFSAIPDASVDGEASESKEAHSDSSKPKRKQRHKKSKKSKQKPKP